MKVLMVCLGNICRSPLAHGILAHKAKESGKNWIVESAGTGNWHIGNAPDSRSIAVAAKYGFDISQQRAQQLTQEMLDYYDKVYVMDEQNYQDVVEMTQNDAQKSKVELFLPGGTVPDPYWDDNMFELVFKMIHARCDQLIKEGRK